MIAATLVSPISKAVAPSPKDISASPLGNPTRVSAAHTKILLAEPPLMASMAALIAVVPHLRELPKSAVSISLDRSTAVAMIVAACFSLYGEVVEAKYAFLINEILSNNAARAPIFGWNSKLRIEGKTVAVKTGTTNNLRDNWCIGWTPSYLAAAWVGNNDSSPMSWVASGISGATPIWNRIMEQMLAEKIDERWPIAEGIVKKRVCGKEEYFVEGTEKSVRCLPKPSPTATEETD